MSRRQSAGHPQLWLEPAFLSYGCCSQLELRSFLPCSKLAQADQSSLVSPLLFTLCLTDHLFRREPVGAIVPALAPVQGMQAATRGTVVATLDDEERSPPSSSHWQNLRFEFITSLKRSLTSALCNLLSNKRQTPCESVHEIGQIIRMRR